MRFRIVALVAISTLGAAGFRVARADEPVSSSVRYNREIVRIFERKCVACHAASGLAMPLERYHDVRPWARAIREEILERRMPPWPAAPGVRPLANELALTTREIVIITSWIDGGTPRGDPWDLPAPPPERKWKTGEPGLTLALPPQQVKLDGSPYVRRVSVQSRLPRERWLRGFDAIAGERSALRSVFLYLRAADGSTRWLGGWTPWYAMQQTPDNVGFRIPGGATFDVELHYAGWSDPQRTATDATTLGLYFQGERPATEVETLTVTAAAADRALRGEALLNQDTIVWAVRPRLDRGEQAAAGAIEMRAIAPNGAIEPILWIKDHRDEWQLPYVLREPLHLTRGTRLVLTAHGEGISGVSISGVSASAAVLTYRPRSASPSATGPIRGPSAQRQPRP